ncbi:MAG: HAD-IIA family hydrolase [Candidatus Enterenecus sp.]
MTTTELLRPIRLFVLDMDGTFYLGDRVIPGAPDFIQKVRDTGREFLFFTNNSSRTPEMYMERLAGMGCPITREQIMTSGDVTIQFLNTCRPGKTVYLMGTESLRRSFADAGVPLVEDAQPDIVAAAFDTELTYRKLERACTYLRNGAEFLATHPDINCPTADGFIPDCGAFCAAITRSTGREPRYLGKPAPETVDMILSRTGFGRGEVAFVGDRLYTDVAVGVRNGAMGLLVLSGETRAEDVAASPVKPHAVFRDLGELAEYL